MRKKMEKLGKKIREATNGELFFTENFANIDEYYGYKYFVIYPITQKVKFAFKTQAEAIEEMEDFLKNGIDII